MSRLRLQRIITSGVCSCFALQFLGVSSSVLFAANLAISLLWIWEQEIVDFLDR